MPFIELLTNIGLPDDKQRELVQDLTQTAAQILGQPVEFFGVRIQAGQIFAFGGSFEPCFIMKVAALDAITSEKNPAYSAQLGSWLQQKLGVSLDRGYIRFEDPSE